MLWSKNYSTMEKQLTCRMPQIRYQSAGRREAMAADCVEGPRYPMNLQTTGSRWTGSRHLEQTRKCVLLKQRNTETKISRFFHDSRSTKCGQQGRKENYKLIWGRGEGKESSPRFWSTHERRDSRWHSSSDSFTRLIAKKTNGPNNMKFFKKSHSHETRNVLGTVLKRSRNGSMSVWTAKVFSEPLQLRTVKDVF